MTRKMNSMIAALALVVGTAISSAAEDAASVIRIRGAVPTPTALEIQRDSSVSWFNDSTKIARIVIEGVDAEQIRCRDQMFRSEAGRLESPPLRPNDTFGSCSLEAGEYQYEVWLGPGSLQGQLGQMVTRSTLTVL